MSTSFPYLALAKALGLDYAAVLRASDWMECGLRDECGSIPLMSDADLRAIDRVQCEESDRRSKVTMTIDELIAELQRRREMHGGDTPVRATWEGVVRAIRPENVYFAPDGWNTLWIDADQNSYKPANAI
jgi:hypothetical protein